MHPHTTAASQVHLHIRRRKQAGTYTHAHINNHMLTKTKIPQTVYLTLLLPLWSAGCALEPSSRWWFSFCYMCSHLEVAAPCRWFVTIFLPVHSNIVFFYLLSKVLHLLDLNMINVQYHLNAPLIYVIFDRYTAHGNTMYFLNCPILLSVSSKLFAVLIRWFLKHGCRCLCHNYVSESFIPSISLVMRMRLSL